MPDIVAATGLAAAFGLPSNAKDVKDLIASFDFGKLVDGRGHECSHGCVFPLAPSFGKLSATTIKAMSDTVKIAIADTTRVIAGLSDKSWSCVTRALAQISTLEQVGEETYRSGKVMEDRGASFVKKSDPDPAATSKIGRWFEDLVQDDDVIKSISSANVPAVAAKIVASSSDRITSRHPMALVVKRTEERLTVLDVGVLRYPDVTQPYFKIYRIQLTAWAGYTRILGVASNKNGIMGEFTARKFKPREEVAARVATEQRQRSAAEAEALFVG